MIFLLIFICPGLKLRESSTRQGYAIIWNFRKYWDMTHLATATVCSGDFKQCAFFFFFIWFCSTNSSRCFFLRFPERHPEAGTVHIPAVIDLKMFDIEVNRTQFVDAVPVSAILKGSIKQTQQGQYQVLILSLYTLKSRNASLMSQEFNLRLDNMLLWVRVLLGRRSSYQSKIKNIQSCWRLFLC